MTNPDTILALAARPDTVGQSNSEVFGPDGYPVGAVVESLATRDGAWVDYLFTNPENGATELKHAWAVHHDGLDLPLRLVRTGTLARR